MSVDTSQFGSAGEAAPELLTVVIHPQDAADVVSVRGEIDLATGPRLRHELAALLDSGRDRIVVDLEQVDFIDSTGLGILLEAHRRTAATGGAMTVVCRPGLCSRLFEISGLDRVFTFAETVEDALNR